MKYLKNISILFLLLLLSSCSSIWKGTESKIHFNIPLNTRVFDKDSVELELHQVQDSTFYVKLKSKNDNKLLFVHDSCIQVIPVKSILNPWWVAFDVFSSFDLFGLPVLLDYALGSWYNIADIIVKADGFQKADVNMTKIEEAGKINLLKRENDFKRNVLFGDVNGWDWIHSYGMNYEYAVFNGFLGKYSSLNLRGGIYGMAYYIGASTVGATLLIGKNNRLEIFAGGIIDFYPPKENSRFLPNSVKNGFSIGYRYQPWDGGVIFRVGYIPFLNVKDLLTMSGKNYGTFYLSLGGAW